ncbi:MAG: alpha/beta fold hydrolase [Planctomycetota bacterium]
MRLTEIDLRSTSSLVRCCCLFAIFLAIGFIANTSHAQRDSKKKDEEERKPRRVTLRTKDNLEISCWYAPSDRGKEAVPVLLVHGWKEEGSVWKPMLRTLIDKNYAVIVPDLRGHGASAVTNPRTKEKIPVDRMTRSQMTMIASRDLETVKGFIKKENEDEKLNMNALVVIATEEGTLFAQNWAMLDWNFPSRGSVKQGQDVRAMVLLSPARSLKGYRAEGVFRDQYLYRLPTLIVAGADSDGFGDAKRIYERLTNMREKTRFQGENLFLLAPDTSLNGVAVVNQMKLQDKVTLFIDNEVVKPMEDKFPWMSRKK